ncbi:MAG: glycoside hydrolase family 5 protein [Omnitrophica WOR_2 bacterium]
MVNPSWRGFNLLELFTIHGDGNFSEDDFRWISDWGFNFARLPACYTLWTEADDIYRLYEPMLAKIDRAIQLGQKYQIHICLNFHRAPGYSVNPERQEPFNLWKDAEGLAAFCFHWETFARRYKGIDSSQLSFNLVNEPAKPEPGSMTRADHERVIRAAVEAIHRIDPQRLIIVDGVNWGTEPCPELADLPVVQSCRAYAPMGVSHYQARWVGGENWPEPAWPGMQPDGLHWDRKRLEEFYRPWVELSQGGVGVHCGEGGAYSYTPHTVVLTWLKDVLDILGERRIGFALWNFRGSFGVLDSNRQDVRYEDWYGHKLDRELLKRLQDLK